MKVLQLCIKPPLPTVDGGTMAMNSITQGLLREGCEVKVLAMESDKHPADQAKMGEEYLVSAASAARLLPPGCVPYWSGRPLTWCIWRAFS